MALLNGCVETLELSEISECMIWQRNRYEIELTTENIQDTMYFWNIEEASWLWMGRHNWFDGERF